MTKVLVISDTHKLIREELFPYLEECDYIIHAGDFDDINTFHFFSGYKNIFMVRGNNDFSINLPDFNQFEIDNKKFFLIHDIADLCGQIPDVDVVVFGHSHKFHNEIKGNTLFLNPGSIGPKRFNLDISFCILEIENQEISVKQHILK